jgi:hypothetical protein
VGPEPKASDNNMDVVRHEGSRNLRTKIGLSGRQIDEFETDSKNRNIDLYGFN